MTQIELLGVSKHFGTVAALRGVNVSIKSSEIFGILGPSGCGKSTLLKLISGLDRPTEGDILFDGRSVLDVLPRDRKTRLMHQSKPLYLDKTVFKNIAFGLRIKGLLKQTTNARVREIAALLRVEHLLDRYPNELSGGEQQRVSLAGVLAVEPDVTLLDEPLSNLDQRLRDDMRFELKQLLQSRGATVIYVTHDQLEALNLCDRVAIMNEGCIEQIDTPSEVYRHPESVFVARFIGLPSMSFVDGAMWPTGIPLGNADRNDILVGFRAEDITVSSSNKNGIAGEIVQRQSMGREDLLYILLAEFPEPITALCKLSHRFGIGDHVMVGLPAPKKLHVFRKSTGKKYN